MDETGNIVITPKDFKSWDFSEGLAAQTLDLFGKCSFIDTTGAMVIAPIYDDCGEFMNALAFVGRVDRRSEYRRGYIDKSGKTLWSSKRTRRQVMFFASIRALRFREMLND